MYWSGIIIGGTSFLIIGMFHPIVIKCEYYFTEKIWPVFLIGGLISCAAAAFTASLEVSAILAILGFTMLWSIGELRHQTKRVAKGWFPQNPKRINVIPSEKINSISVVKEQ